MFRSISKNIPTSSITAMIKRVIESPMPMHSKVLVDNNYDVRVVDEHGNCNNQSIAGIDLGMEERPIKHDLDDFIYMYKLINQFTPKDLQELSEKMNFKFANELILAIENYFKLIIMCHEKTIHGYKRHVNYMKSTSDSIFCYLPILLNLVSKPASKPMADFELSTKKITINPTDKGINFTMACELNFTLNEIPKLPVTFDFVNSVCSSPVQPIVATEPIFNRYVYSLVDYSEFYQRLGYFISNDKNANISADVLSGVLSSRCALTGSAMAAIIPKHHPAIEKAGSWKDYVDKFYAKSDLDIIVDDDMRGLLHSEVDIPKRVQAYFVEITRIIEKLTINLGEAPKVTIIKNLYINTKSDLSKEHLYGQYCALKSSYDNSDETNLIRKLTSLAKFENMTVCREPGSNMVDSKYYTMMYDKSTSYREIIRVKLHTSCLKPIEIFFAPYGIAKTVGNFHLDCVKSFYYESTVHMFPQAQQAYLTMKCNGYRAYINKSGGKKSVISRQRMIQNIKKYTKRGYIIENIDDHDDDSDSDCENA